MSQFIPTAEQMGAFPKGWTKAMYEQERGAFLVPAAKGLYGVVTGCASRNGIGSAIALRYLLEQGNGILLVDIKGEELAETADDLRSIVGRADAKIATLALDVTDEQAPSKIWTAAMEAFDGQVDSLFSNVGWPENTPLWRLDRQALDKALSLNLTSHLLLAQHFAAQWGIQDKPLKAAAKASGELDTPQVRWASWTPLLRNRSITFTGSVAKKGLAGLTFYGVGKAGVAAAAGSISTENIGFDIRANVIDPGWTKTDMTDALNYDTQIRPQVERTIAKRLGVPKEIASMAVHVAGWNGLFIVGTAIPVDGMYC